MLQSAVYSLRVYCITLSLPVLSADELCKPSQTVWTWIKLDKMLSLSDLGPNCLTLMVFLNVFFFVDKADERKDAKLPSMQRVNHD